jgi:hypothetical protein
MIIRTITRTWDVVAGLALISISLLVQAMFCLVLSMCILGVLEGVFGYKTDKGAWLLVLLLPGLFLLFNGISLYEYFVKRRVKRLGTPSLGSGVDALKATVAADSGHVSMIMFLLPRGIDRIISGKETVQ